MRISKSLAQSIARKLTEEKQKQVKSIQTDFRQYITDCYNAQIPKEVSEIAKKHPEWFNSRGVITFSGHGFSYTNVTSIGNVLSNANYNAVLYLNDKIATKAKKLQNKYLDADKKLGELQTKIEVTLIGLGSFKKIQEHLPEAVPFLPKSTSVELMVNFDVLRADINKKTI